MTQSIEPFVRVNNHQDHVAQRRWPVIILRVMQVHLLLFGFGLFIGGVALFAYLYSLEFERIDITSGLRITRHGAIYTSDFQISVLGVLVLLGLSLLQFRVANLLAQRRRSGLVLARISAILLAFGLPVGLYLWVLSSGATGDDSGLFNQLMHELVWGVRLAAGVLIVQALLAMWYGFASLLRPMQQCCRAQLPLGNLLLRRIRRLSIFAWAVVIIALAVVLGILTDWIFELPVPEPEPGELLYVTSFERFNDEWDVFPGRDSAQVVDVGDLITELAMSPVPALDRKVLVINYGAGVSDEIIWSTLNRKFRDFDLRVTARLIQGPIDQNQFGVIFRYRDPDNFYIFRITADGYYSLVKVRSGVQERISDWGVSDAILQGDAPNEVRVVARDDRFKFYVNGMALPLCMKGENETSMWANWEGPGVCFTDEPRFEYVDGEFRQGRIALAAGTIDGSDVTVAFDDLVLVGPAVDANAVSERE